MIIIDSCRTVHWTEMLKVTVSNPMPDMDFMFAFMFFVGVIYFIGHKTLISLYILPFLLQFLIV